MPFLFENLSSYQKAVTFAYTVDQMLESVSPKVSRNLSDQLSRAALSISLNIAEGNGRWHKPDKRQFFYIARGSTFECVPLLQLLKKKGLVDESQYKVHYEALEELSKMLSGLIKSVDEQ